MKKITFLLVFISIFGYSQTAITDANIQTAVDLWVSDPSAATTAYGADMEKIEMLKRIIDDQAILINKLQGYLVGDIIQTPKKIKKTRRQIMDAEARIMVTKVFERLQKQKNHLN